MDTTPTVTPTNDAASRANLDAALKGIRSAAAGYNLYDNYIQGDQRLSFATDKFSNAFGSLFREFADNVCGSVIDAPADRLSLTGFSVEEGDSSLGETAWKLWQSNRLAERAGETHATALGLGDAYVLVWPGKDGKPRVYVNDPRGMYVRYDEEDPGTILWAAKAWVTRDKQKRVNLYYPDRIEKYISVKQGNTSTLPDNSKGLTPYNVPGEPWPLPNQYGVLPVFHFANNAPIGQMGVSEIKQVVPIQDALNKTIMDMMVAMEFNAFPQRWVTGIEVAVDPLTGKPSAPFQPGAERLWAAGDENTKFGEFSASDLGNYTGVADNFRVEVARISGTPLHYMGLPDSTGRALSGEALKVLESRFVKKVKDRQNTWGDVWERVMSLCLQIAGSTTAPVILSAEWEDAAPSTELEKATIADLWLNKCNLDEEYVWGKMGIPQAEIDRMLAESKAAQPLAPTATAQLPASLVMGQAMNGQQGMTQAQPAAAPTANANGKRNNGATMPMMQPGGR